MTATACLRIAYFGTPEIAVPTLERLLEGPHEVCVVVSQPDRGRGRGRKTSPSPVSRAASRRGRPAAAPRAGGVARVPRGAGRSTPPDLGVVVAFGQFLPRKVRELPRLGYLVNAHASLLPRHRGAAPIAHAILAGDRKTGISVMRVEREMDAGPVALVREIEIGDDEDAGSLATRLAALAAGGHRRSASTRSPGSRIEWTEQDASRATFAPKIGRDDARLDFREPAQALLRRVRAMAPSPGAFTRAGRRAPADPRRPRRRRAGRRRARQRCGATPADALRIATGAGWLVPLQVQRAGGSAMAHRGLPARATRSRTARASAPPRRRSGAR